MYLYTILKNVYGLENIFFFFLLVVDPQLLSEGHAWTQVTGYGSSPDMTTVDMQLPIMETVMTFQLVDRPPPVPSMVDMLTIVMGRLLTAMDMDMLLSATDMTLLNMDMDRPLPECSP